MAGLLAAWPEEAPFAETANGAAFWMDQVADKLKSAVLWKLWDIIERRAPRAAENPDSDIYTTSLNDPAGNLASVLLKKTPKPKGDVELGKALRERYVRLLATNDFFARLARGRFSAAVSFLFERAPTWTTANILPSYEWTSPDALAMSSAHKYANHIGSARLFALTKAPFLELFSRQEAAREYILVFADWLAIILVVNQAKKAEYPLTATEVRSVLRTTGNEGRWSFAHQLAAEMEAAQPAEEKEVWGDIIGPVFEGAWPLDAELQSPRVTFKLVQLLLATGEAFGGAAPIVIPFIRPEEARASSSVFSISEADPEIYSVAPDQMLKPSATNFSS